MGVHLSKCHPHRHTGYVVEVDDTDSTGKTTTRTRLCMVVPQGGRIIREVSLGPTSKASA